MSRNLNRALKVGGENLVINSIAVKVVEYDVNGRISRATTAGTVASLVKTNVFAKGCQIVKTNAADGTKAIYENVGTIVTPSWNLLGETAAGDITLSDGDILVGNASGVGAGVTASGDVTNDNAGAFTIANDAVTEAKTADSDGTSGLYVKKTALATYDFSVDGGAQGAIVLADVVTLPDNAVCTAVTYDVITTATSNSDAATIALTLPTDGALTTAIAISDGTNPWDAGVHLASVITPLAVKTTAARAIGITVAGGEDLTAGKIVFAVDYYVSQ